MFKSAFCQSAINSLGETTVGYTLEAARCMVLAYDWYTETFFSAKSQARYQEIGAILGTMMVVAVAAGMTARIIVEDFAGNIPAVEEDYEEIFGNIYDDADDEITDYMDDEDLPSISHEDYLDRLVELEGMTLKALVPIAAELNLVTRKVRKGVLIEAILKAEGYEA